MNVCGSNITPRNITEKVTGKLKYELFKSEFVYFEVQREFRFLMENLEIDYLLHLLANLLPDSCCLPTAISASAAAVARSPDFCFTAYPSCQTPIRGTPLPVMYKIAAAAAFLLNLM